MADARDSHDPRSSFVIATVHKCAPLPRGATQYSIDLHVTLPDDVRTIDGASFPWLAGVPWPRSIKFVSADVSDLITTAEPVAVTLADGGPGSGHGSGVLRVLFSRRARIKTYTYFRLHFDMNIPASVLWQQLPNTVTVTIPPPPPLPLPMRSSARTRASGSSASSASGGSTRSAGSASSASGSASGTGTTAARKSTSAAMGRGSVRAATLRRAGDPVGAAGAASDQRAAGSAAAGASKVVRPSARARRRT
jgi:hypothetical protein